MPTYTLSREEMKNLARNRRALPKAPPKTTRATFKLSELEDLIREIKKTIGIPKPTSKNDYHTVCIMFVRDNIDNSILGYTGCLDFSTMVRNSTTVNGVRLSQLIPIITGCRAVLDQNTGRYKNFRFMKRNGKIPYVRPGGETSGMIPPPPPNDDSTNPG